MPITADTLKLYPNSVFIECLPAESLVWTPPESTVRTFRHRYTGPLIEITTSSGDVLTATPNHPVLTAQGWLASGLLQEGDDLITDRFLDWVGIRDPNIQHVPAMIEEVCESFQAGIYEGASSPSVDFNGHLPGGQIKVISTNRSLLGNNATTLSEPLHQHNLASTHLTPGHRPAIGPPGQRRLFSGLASIDAPGTLLHITQSLGITLSTNLHGLFPRTRMPSATGYIGDPPSGHSHFARNNRWGFSRDIPANCFTRVLKTRRVPSAGHVFNLQTKDGWFQANNIIVHNTGSFLGDGVQAALDAGFPKVYTIEADQWLWAGVDNRFQTEPKVTALLGLSTQHLLGLLGSLTEPATLFLDAHTCTHNGAGAWACPLVEELRQLAVQTIRTHTILIDDLHLCGLELPGMTELRERLAKINPNYKLSYAPSAEPSLGMDILVAQP